MDELEEVTPEGLVVLNNGLVNVLLDLTLAFETRPSWLVRK